MISRRVLNAACKKKLVISVTPSTYLEYDAEENRKLLTKDDEEYKQTKEKAPSSYMQRKLTISITPYA